MSHLFYYLSMAMIIATPITGIILLINKLVWSKKRLQNAEPPWYVAWSDFWFPVLLFTTVLRCFIVEPFTIPSGSMQPTLYAGDMIIANKWSFGIRYPITNQRIFSDAGDGVKRGDIAVFRYPEDTRINYIKRIVGLPGDVIDYQNKTLMVNGTPVTLTPVGAATKPESDLILKETLPSQLAAVTHEIQVNSQLTMHDYGVGLKQTFPVTVPSGMYFALGDNRDASADSRFWGFVPDTHLVGKANFIWMNYHCVLKFKDCHRIFTILR